ncbi:MAG: 4Fe-4S dicluster domain-containing protein [Eubacteriales bacterium]|nr:4Fe-4S dicluster domain-containing protein [Eubacteriales bacterium]
MYKIRTERLPELFALAAADKALYLPVEQGGQVEFRPWSEGAAVRFDALNTVRSAKDLFFPQTENLVAFRTEGKKISIIENADTGAPFGLMGVRSCDAKSFEILDRVFLAEPADTYYKARRENGTVVTLACHEPEETCFCAALGIDAAESADGDAASWIRDGWFYLKPVTAKGEASVETVRPLLTECDGADDAAVEAEKKDIGAVIGQLPFSKLDLSRFRGENMLEIFNDPRWKELSAACLGCGTCTYVCPTCQCYDIKDFKTGDGIQRFRTWDSCMYSDFTKMSAGQPRLTQVERFRQRFMHKLVYYPMNNDGLYSCVGCGRCLRKCPISMNIVKVAKTLGGEQNDEQ